MAGELSSIVVVEGHSLLHGVNLALGSLAYTSGQLLQIVPKYVDTLSKAAMEN